ncbi:hypothetical protein RQP46_010912 [Phenoliferia psychrophenolica]
MSCVVCSNPGTLRCSRCRSTLFCSTEHQALLWSTHKIICKPDTPLTFAQPPLTRLEFENYVFGEPSKAKLVTSREITHDDHAMTRAHRLAHSTTTSSSPGSIDIGTFQIQRDPVTGQYGFELPIGDELGWSMYKARLDRTPPLGASDVYASGRAWLLRNDPTKITPSMLPFSRLGVLLIETRRLKEGELAYPISRIVHLDEAARNAFELQLLVILTLFQRNAPTEILELNFSRLENMAGNDAGARGVWAAAVEMVLSELAAKTEEKAGDDQ